MKIYKISLICLGFNFPTGISHIKRIFDKNGKFVFFDIGASVGNFTYSLLENFPNSSIHCFEPSQKDFEYLKQKFSNNNNVICNNFAISLSNDLKILYDINGNNTSAHASLKNIVIERFKNVEIIQNVINTNRLDKYISENKIGIIDYIKIDVEGYEYECILSLSNYISSVRYIQFEYGSFNQLINTNISTFQNLLEGFILYRVLNDGKLIPIKDEPISLQGLYARHEILAKNRFL